MALSSDSLECNEETTSGTPQGRERRKFERFELSVPARFLCRGDEEMVGELLDVSQGGLAIATEARPPLGTDTVLYIEDIGRMQGKVVRHLNNGFAVQFEASDAKRQRLAAKLAWLNNRDEEEPPPSEISVSTEPTGPVRFTRDDGTESECKVLDMSVDGVWLQVEPRPPVGEVIQIGRMRGRVSRHHQTGIAIEFIRAP